MSAALPGGAQAVDGPAARDVNAREEGPGARSPCRTGLAHGPDRRWYAGAEDDLSDWLRIMGGGVLLYLGGEWLVGGAAALAVGLRIPQLLVGLTVVAYGTSAPELVVEVSAAAAGHGAVALGDAIGSSVANIGLILGLAALIRPARVADALHRRELPLLLASAVAVPLLLLDGVVGPVEAGALLATAIGYTAYVVLGARAAATVARATAGTRVAERTADAAGAPAPGGTLRSLATAAAGLGLLVLGGTLLVDGAVSIARALGMSERLVGVTIVAVGTSLPELVASAVAAAHGHSDIAVGNVIGSNVFNVFFCLAVAALVGPVGAPLGAVGVDVLALLVFTGCAVWLLRRARTVSRVEGLALICLYVGYLGLTVRGG